MALEARDREGRHENLLTPTVEIRSAKAERATVGLEQVASGRYETHLVADTTGPLTFSVIDATATPGVGSAPHRTTDASAGNQASRILVVDQAAELRFAPPDEALLLAISRATGGTLRPSPDDVLRAPRRAGTARHPLAPWLLALALVLWPVDIALRRFRW